MTTITIDNADVPLLAVSTVRAALSACLDALAEAGALEARGTCAIAWAANV
jgi:hypothetical protein